MFDSFGFGGWGSNVPQQTLMNNGMMTEQMQMQIMNGQMPKIPAPTTRNIQMFLAGVLNMPVAMLEFIPLTESFASQNTQRHACKFSLLQIEELPVRTIQYYDKATVDFAYCPNCCRVIYYVEKVGY